MGRAAGADFGLWGNSKEEANYFMSYVEGEGEIVFAKENLPPLKEIGFYSITAHDEKVLVHPNEFDSYVLTMDKMRFEEDGIAGGQVLKPARSRELAVYARWRW